MTTVTAPLILTTQVQDALHSLRRLAAFKPVDMTKLEAKLATPKGKLAHDADMTAQTVVIPGPWPFLVTLSIETDHPNGAVCRHMSMSIKREDRVPSPEAVWMIAEELGFVGSYTECAAWPEKLTAGGTAVNVLQIITNHHEAEGLAS